MVEPQRDVESRDDLRAIVDRFYEMAYRDDELLRHIFEDVAQLDLPVHIPIVVDFWEKVIFRTGTYNRGAYAPHEVLHQQVPLGEQEFAHWLATWEAAINSLYQGPTADRMIARGHNFADAWKKRLDDGIYGDDYAPGDKVRLKVQLRKK